ncbi:coiled-coil domain-containing protein [Arabiibacter massiliensis]|uniref:coiled-coil domain-containing protein n=1 Tax=Arabiibacter massiliensis TaxID=1870985 RepID=UPI0009BAD7D0|nr:NlpC/P60 family protein [Arabiibacter massiliensis]
MQKPVSLARPFGILAILAAILMAAVLVAPTPAHADPSSAEKRAEAQAALATLDSMQSTLEQAADAYDEALAAQAEAEANRDEAQGRIDEASAQIADVQERLAARASSMYRTGGSSFLDLLLGSATFQEFATNWDLLNAVNRNDAQLVQQAKDLRAEIEDQQATYAEQARVAADKADEAKRKKDETASTIAAMQATYDGLDAEAAALLEQEREAQRAAEEAQAQSVVEAAIEQAERDNGNGNGDTSDPSPAPSPSPAPEPSYNEPIAGSVVERAYSQIGKAYGYDDPSYGAGPSAYDCSGFVSFCLSGSYSRMGSTLTFLAWPRVDNPQPGDVAVNEGHCGIYVGGGMMVHASTYGVGVIEGPVQAGMVFVRP